MVLIVVAGLVVVLLFIVLSAESSSPSSSAQIKSHSPEPDSQTAPQELSFEEHCELLIEDD